MRNFDTSQHSTRIQNSELAVASCTLLWRHREELKSLTKAPLQIEREDDHVILNGLPLSFPPRSCGFNHSGRSSMASVHMVASFEVADSVCLGMSGSFKVADAITVFFQGNCFSSQNHLLHPTAISGLGHTEWQMQEPS